MPQTRHSQDSDKSKTSTPAAKQTAAQARGSAPLTLQSALADPRSASPAQVLQLQRHYGNRAIQRLIQRAALQRDQDSIGLEGGPVGGDLQNQINSARGGGQPLDRGVGSQMGGALGADLSGVKVHTDSKSDNLNRSLSAKAFTLGSDMFFSKGAYNPGTHSGKQLLAHELTHVVQQGASKTNKVQTKLTVGPAGDKYEEEADQVAKRVLQRTFVKPNRLSRDSVAQGAMPAVIQRTMAGAHKALVKEGGGITHLARFNKVATFGIKKSTYDKLIDAVHDYEEAEQKGKKSNQWLVARLMRIETLCDEWLNDPTHKKEQASEDKLALARASAISIVLERAQNERLQLGGSGLGEKSEKQGKTPQLEVDVLFEEDSSSEEGEKEIPRGKQEKQPTLPTTTKTPSYDFGYDPASSEGVRRLGVFTKYVDNCRLAGLPLQQVLKMARQVVTRWEGWDNEHVDFNYAYGDKFKELVLENVAGATATIVKACFTPHPNLELLQSFASKMEEVSGVDETFEMEDEQTFVSLAVSRFKDKMAQAAFIKLWQTANGPQKRHLFSLVSIDIQMKNLSGVEYLAEATDPQHRYGLSDLMTQWTKESSRIYFGEWIEGQSSAKDRTPVKYYTTEERQRFRVTPGPSLTYTESNAPLKGDNIFVMSGANEIYAANKETSGSVRLHHSSFLAGQPVKSAGHFFTSSDGTLTSINDQSGHYQPEDEQLAQALAVLKKAGTELAGVKATIGDRTYEAEELLSKFL